jgi:hypothetical protein
VKVGKAEAVRLLACILDLPSSTVGWNIGGADFVFRQFLHNMTTNVAILSHLFVLLCGLFDDTLSSSGSTSVK